MTTTAERQKRAERIAERVSKDAAEDVLTIYAWDVPEDWEGLVAIVKQAAAPQPPPPCKP